MQVHAWFEWTCARCKHLPRLHNFVILKTSWRLMWVDLDQNNQFTSPQSHSINTVDTCDDNKVISCFSASCDALCGSVRPFTRLLRFLIEQAHCLVSVSIQCMRLGWCLRRTDDVNKIVGPSSASKRSNRTFPASNTLPPQNKCPQFTCVRDSRKTGLTSRE